MHNKKESVFLFILILLVSTGITIFFEFNNKKVQIRNKLIIEKGVLDISRSGIKHNQLAGLSGDVEFYWNQLLTPTDFQRDSTLTPDGYIHIPGIWNNFEKEGNKIGGFGYATYRFKIKLHENGWYGLRIKEFDSAYNIWVNSKYYANSGIVGKTKQETTPRWNRNEVYFETEQKEVEVIIQVANFTHRKGGAEDRMLLGYGADIMNYKQRQIGIGVFLLGTLIILGLYHLVLFIFRRKEKSFILFSLLCFLMALRLMSVGEKLITEFFPELSWELAIRIEYLSYKLIIPLMFSFMHTFYPQYISKTIIKLAYILTGIFCLIIIFTPAHIFTFTPIFFQVIIALSSIYMLIIMGIAVYDKEENSTIFFLSFAFFFFITINDILFYNNLINSSYTMPLGLFILAISQAIILSKNFSSAFIRIEELTTNLEQYNRELEKIVEERTLEIKGQRDEIEKQAQNLQTINNKLVELSSFKESLTEMIVHDLKNPLNIVLNFSKEECVLFAGNQMLHLVQNLLDVQRYENSEMKLSKENVSVSSLIEEALYQLNFMIKEKDIELIIKNEGDSHIEADQEIMNRVIVNLLSNALKFTPSHGKITIYVKSTIRNVNICIADTGPGIPKDKKDVVFEKFGQLISNPTSRLGSSGLGLTFCKMAVEAHGGKIDFTSVLGKGTTFCVKLQPALHTSNNSFFVSGRYNQEPVINIELTSEEKKTLSEILAALENTELYEISKIKKLLSSIGEDESENIKNWLAAVQKTIWNSDEKVYKKLISIAK